ncbi:MAG: HAD family phosphatase [Verrucomicrobiota bacterium]
MIFPDVNFEGYLFDCDGTLADSMPIHYIAWCKALKQARATYEFPEELFYQLGGTTTARIVDILNDRYGGDLVAEEVAHVKEAIFLEHLHQVKPIKPVIDFAMQCAEQGKPMAVVSGGVRHVVEKTIQLIHMDGIFEIIITPEAVKHGKPAPDMFLLAAEKLGVEPRKCMVLEDGIKGIEGAAAAGMCSYFIPQSSF